MADLDKCYAVVLELVKEGGKIIAKNIRKQKTINEKTSDTDLVTETDKEVEKLLIEKLAANFPGHKFIGEESSGKVTLTNDPTWIIDPVDGTMNFVHTFPQVCISIALYVNKVPEIGIIYNPIFEQLFTARKGLGAYLNEERIKVSGEKYLSKALLVVEPASRGDMPKLKTCIENMTKLGPLIHGTRALGSCALNMCAVAQGAADVHLDYGMSIWDVAAGDLIIREAGGVVIDPAGGNFDPLNRRCLSASSMELAQEVAKRITQYYPDPH